MVKLLWVCVWGASSAFATDSTGELDVLWHDGHTLGMDGAKVGIFEETNYICLGSFLQSANGSRLESEVLAKILSDFTNKTLEWELSDQELGPLLIFTDFTKSNGSWSVSLWFLDSTRCWGRPASGLGGQLPSWSFATGGLPSGLFNTGHVSVV